MEEETITQLMVKEKSPHLELQQLGTSIVVLGSFDIAERFQAYLERQLERAIDLAEGECGENILNEIVKQKKKFLDVRFLFIDTKYLSAHLICA
ncbi:MAG: hypothetical protein M1840_001512 [Geoglossum simile]|nr:MAG: hypothetical protein M1840_001512 [Geoglossum simile]